MNNKNKKSMRLNSLNALRGTDIFMISGGGPFIYYMYDLTNYECLNTLAYNMEHPAWLAAITFFDLIFPLFLFISGISLIYSVNFDVFDAVVLVWVILYFLYKNKLFLKV